MIPQATPTNSFSARWLKRDRRTGSRSSSKRALRAVAVATSTAAEDERPAPEGTSPSTTASKPPRA